MIAGSPFYFEEVRRPRNFRPLDRADRSRHHSPPRFGHRGSGAPPPGDEAAKKALRKARGQHLRLLADHVRVKLCLPPGAQIPGAPSYSQLTRQLRVPAVQYDSWGALTPIVVPDTSERGAFAARDAPSHSSRCDGGQQRPPSRAAPGSRELSRGGSRSPSPRGSRRHSTRRTRRSRTSSSRTSTDMARSVRRRHGSRRRRTSSGGRRRHSAGRRGGHRRSGEHLDVFDEEPAKRPAAAFARAGGGGYSFPLACFNVGGCSLATPATRHRDARGAPPGRGASHGALSRAISTSFTSGGVADGGRPRSSPLRRRRAPFCH